MGMFEYVLMMSLCWNLILFVYQSLLGRTRDKVSSCITCAHSVFPSRAVHMEDPLCDILSASQGYMTIYRGLAS